MATLTTTFTTFASVTRMGSNGIGWSSPSNAQTSDDTRATLSSTPDASAYTDYLKCTGLTDALPSGAVVSGIKITIERKDSNGQSTDSAVRLVVGGTIQGDNKASSTQWPTTDTNATYGSTTDLWGLTPTREQLNGSDFGVVVSCNVGTGGPSGGTDTPGGL